MQTLVICTLGGDELPGKSLLQRYISNRIILAPQSCRRYDCILFMLHTFSSERRKESARYWEEQVIIAISQRIFHIEQPNMSQFLTYIVTNYRDLMFMVHNSLEKCVNVCVCLCVSE